MPFLSSSSFSAGEAVEYKYVIIKMDGTLQWEGDIENRVFTAEGTELRLDDGEFNVQKKRALKADFSASATRRQRLVSLAAMDHDLPIDLSSCIYVVTYRLPLVATYDANTKSYDFEWMSFAADDPARENKGVLRSTSRHGLYVIENLRSLRDRCKVASPLLPMHTFVKSGNTPWGSDCLCLEREHASLLPILFRTSHSHHRNAGLVCGRSGSGRAS
jgi:hypothetical protein